MLKIQNLTVQINNQVILKNLNLQVQPGSVHALMGPNGSGKSTLAYTIMGHPSCQVTTGNLIFQGQDITDLAIDKRARLGIFLAFQYPQAVPGLKVFNFLKAAYEAFACDIIPPHLGTLSSEAYPHLGTLSSEAYRRADSNKSIGVSVLEFKQILDNALITLGLNPELIERDLNDGFSGGEKKRLEMLQLYLLQPKIAIIDEIDSGLDVDALKTVAQVLQACRARDPEFTIILVTHYRRILEYLKPDFVHVVAHGELVASGTEELSHKIDQSGYGLYV
jgi:Fe-S cluster assembly ATP-binding protein